MPVRRCHPLPLAAVVVVIAAEQKGSTISEPSIEVVAAEVVVTEEPPAAIFGEVAHSHSSKVLSSHVLASSAMALAPVTSSAMRQRGRYCCNGANCEGQRDKTRYCDLTKHRHGSFPIKRLCVAAIRICSSNLVNACHN